MQKAYPANENDPLFCIQESPVTWVQARAHLKKILKVLHFHHFHTFGRSGATLAFNQNIDLKKIKAKRQTDRSVWGKAPGSRVQ